MQAVTQERIDELVSKSKVLFNRPTKTMTVCLLALPIGFSLLGQSACIDPEKYDQKIGEQLAKEDAINQLWKLEGYLLSWMNTYVISHPEGASGFIKEVEDGVLSLNFSEQSEPETPKEKSLILTLN